MVGICILEGVRRDTFSQSALSERCSRMWMLSGGGLNLDWIAWS